MDDEARMQMKMSGSSPGDACEMSDLICSRGLWTNQRRMSLHSYETSCSSSLSSSTLHENTPHVDRDDKSSIIIHSKAVVPSWFARDSLIKSMIDGDLCRALLSFMIVPCIIFSQLRDGRLHRHEFSHYILTGLNLFTLH